jgi:Zn-finger nucleic acid-binding protein
MLRCPTDGYPLVPRAIGSASILVCEKCSGVWFTREALVTPSVDPADLPAASRTPIVTTRKRRRVASCPVCRRVLLAMRIEGIDIERCAHCAGVWLDPGEYDAVRHRIEHPYLGTGARANPTGAKGSPSGTGDGFELVLALLEFLA